MCIYAESKASLDLKLSPCSDYSQVSRFQPVLFLQVLMLIDASFGFEMETFEFLNICQVHGFPRIMGVLTHLDSFKNSKALNKTKKRLKHRFWTEVYQVRRLMRTAV